MDKVTFEVGKPSCAEQHSRYKEECRHAKCAQVQHSHVDVCETLFNVVQAHQQQHESLEFVNPPNSCHRLVAHASARNHHPVRSFLSSRP